MQTTIKLMTSFVRDILAKLVTWQIQILLAILIITTNAQTGSKIVNQQDLNAKLTPIVINNIRISHLMEKNIRTTLSARGRSVRPAPQKMKLRHVTLTSGIHARIG